METFGTAFTCGLTKPGFPTLPFIALISVLRETGADDGVLMESAFAIFCPFLVDSVLTLLSDRSDRADDTPLELLARRFVELRSPFLNKPIFSSMELACLRGCPAGDGAPRGISDWGLAARVDDCTGRILSGGHRFGGAPPGRGMCVPVGFLSGAPMLACL